MVFVLVGLEAFTLDMESIRRELILRYPKLTFVLLIGESVGQWRSSSVLWSNTDRSEVILGRCKYIVYDGTLPHLLTNLAFADWATVDLQLILEDPQRCRLYQGLDEQWTLCREGRAKRSEGTNEGGRRFAGRHLRNRVSKK